MLQIDFFLIGWDEGYSNNGIKSEDLNNMICNVLCGYWLYSWDCLCYYRDINMVLKDLMGAFL